MKFSFKDKNGEYIKGDCILIHNNGEERYVFMCKDGTLAFCAENKPFVDDIYNRIGYPLYLFNLDEWRIKK